MTDLFIEAYNVTSPSGITAGENYNAVMSGKTGVARRNISHIHHEPFYASVLDDRMWNRINFSSDETLTAYESMLMHSISDALSDADVTDVKSPDTILIFSSTKGNIGLLETGAAAETEYDHLSLYGSAAKIAAKLQNPNQPVVISNACISGVTALLYASRLIRSGRYRHAIVAGADTFSRFVFSGFYSFQAISPGNCKPFSASRDGINLGEAAATMIISRDAGKSKMKLLSGAVTNDSNHISGPSRTGNELAAAIEKAMELSRAVKNDVAFISAHGTATPYNDEMEAKAFRTAGLGDVYVNSLKGCFGHTLGAAGLVESVISVMAFENNLIPPTFGYDGIPVLEGMNVSSSPVPTSSQSCFLKTASGFGGCNAAILFGKN
jgi:3-oxoacyl-[acyl-carrier-protein] synthase I